MACQFPVAHFQTGLACKDTILTADDQLVGELGLEFGNSVTHGGAMSYKSE